MDHINVYFKIKSLPRLMLLKKSISFQIASMITALTVLATLCAISGFIPPKSFTNLRLMIFERLYLAVFMHIKLTITFNLI